MCTLISYVVLLSYFDSDVITGSVTFGSSFIYKKSKSKSVLWDWSEYEHSGITESLVENEFKTFDCLGGALITISL
jgi:hypothetical protein